MADSVQTTYRPLLEAVSFAARAHRHQLRKDNQTPYVSHVFRVCLIVRQIFGIDDPRALMAAVLHDTIEDTNTDFDDVLEHFQDTEMAQWVATLSKDKRMPEQPREEAYRAGLAKAPWQVKVGKLADIFDNLMDSVHLSARQRSRACQRSHQYLQALEQGGVPEQARRPLQIVSQLLAEVEAATPGRESRS
jgi:guanosine-3',5'-bis(diphosphate) 3'-pyrophosphohydrolase